MSDSVWTFLIVEESPGERARIRRRLTRGLALRHPARSCRVREAASGAEAMLLLNGNGSGAVDCVLTRDALPDMHARDLLALLAGGGEAPTIPAVVLTRGDAADEIELLRAGASEVVGGKQVTGRALARAVDTAIARSAAAVAVAERERRLAILARTGFQLLHRVAIDPSALHAIFAEVGAAIDVELFFCYEPEVTQDLLRLVTSGGLSGAERAAFAEIRFGQYLCGQVALRRERLVLEDLAQTAYPEAAALREGGVRCYAGFPLVANGELLGTVAYATRRRDRFSDADLAFIQSVGDQVAVRLARDRDGRRLRDSEANFRALAEAAPTIIWTAAPDGRIRFQNRQWLDYTGLTPELNETDWTRLVLHPDDVDRCVEAWQRSLATGEDYEIEVRNRRRDGEYRWFLTRAVPLRDEAGTIVRWYGSTTDIHDRRQADEHARELQRFLESIFATAPHTIYILDLHEHRTVFVSRHGDDDLGYSDEELRSWDDPDFLARVLHPDDYERLGALLHRWEAASDQDVFETEVRLRRKNGGWTWRSVREKVFSRDDRGRVRRILGVAQDINTRKRAEEALSSAEAERRRVLENISAFVGVTTADGTLVASNRILDGSEPPAADAIGMKLWDCPWWDAARHGRDRLRDACARAARGETVRFDVRLRPTAGAPRWIDLQIAPLREIDGRVTRLIPSGIDVTDRRRVEEHVSFLADMSATFATLDDPAEIVRAAVDGVRVHLEVSRAHVSDVGAAGDEITEIGGGDGAQGDPIGDLLSEHAGDAIMAALRTGLTVAIEDVTADPRTSSSSAAYQRRAIGAMVLAPYVSDGRWKCLLTAYKAAPHAWRRDEIELLQEFTAHVHVRLERTRADRALLLHDRAMAASDAGVLIVDARGPDLPLVYASAGFERLTGYAVDEVMGRNCRFLQGPDTDRAQVARIRGALVAGEPIRVTLRNYRKDGTPFWNDLSISPVHDAAGRLTHFVGVQNDVTDLLGAQAAAEASEARLQLGMRVARLAIADVDYQTDTTHLSADAARMFGFGDDAVRVSRAAFHDRFHPDDREALTLRIDASRDPAGPGFFDMDHRIVLPDGTVRWLRARKQVFFEGHGAMRRPVRAVLAALDITEEKGTADAVRRAEQFLRGVLNSLPERVAVLDDEGVVRAVNAPWEEVARQNVGAPQAMSVGADYLEACRRGVAAGDPYARRALEGLQAVLAGRWASCVLEYPHRGPDGERWFLLHARRAGHGVGGVVLSQIDITNQKRTEEALCAAEERFRHAIDAAHALVYDVDPAGRRPAAVYGLDRVTGHRVDAEAATSAWWHTLIHPDDLPGHLAAFARQVRLGHGNWVWRYRIRHADGTWRHVEDVGEVVRHADGKVERLVGTVRDVTDRVVAEQALRESEARYRASFDIINVGKMEVDASTGKFILVNDAYCQIVGWPREALLNMGPADLIHPDDRAWDGPVVAAFFRGETDNYSAEKRFLRQDGSVVWVHVNCGLTRDASGRPLQSVGVLEDITARMRAEEALRDSEQRRAEALERALQVERETAQTLQRSLLPQTLPPMLGAAVAVRYRTASPNAEVSGDCYDVFELPGGQMGIVIGDVAGKGIPAAAVMGRIRAALRAYAADGYSPGEILARLNRGADPGDMATLIVLTFDPATGRIVYANAGHLPPLVRASDGRTKFLEEGRAAPIGSNPEKRYPEATTTLEEGSTIVLYTDGLVEEKSVPIDDGLADLARLVANQTGDVDSMVDSILGGRLRHREPIDDVAVLALQAVPFDPHYVALRIPATPASVPALRHALKRWLRAGGAEGEGLFALLVAAGEAASNGVEHAYGARDATLDVEGRRTGDVVTITIRDTGRWRAPRGAHRGRGQQLMRSLIDDVDITSGPDGTTVRLRHTLNKEAT